MKSFDNVFIEIGTSLGPLEAMRKKKLMLNWILVLVTIILFVCGIAAIMDEKTLQMGTWIMILAVVFGIVALVIGIMGNSKYKKTFKAAVMPSLFKAISPELNYDMGRFITSDKFDLSLLYKGYYNKYNGEDLIWGDLDGTSVEISELDVQHESGTGKNRSVHTIFKGLFIIADNNSSASGRVVVLPDSSEKLFGGLAKVFQKMTFNRDPLVTMNNKEFEKQFKVYSNIPGMINDVLTEDMMQKMLDIQRKLNKKIAFSIIENKMYLAVHSKHNYFNPKLGRSVLNPALIHGFYNELESIVSLVDDLKSDF